MMPFISLVPGWRQMADMLHLIAVSTYTVQFQRTGICQHYDLMNYMQYLL